MSQRIDEKTDVKLFAVIASLPFVIGFIFWLSSVDAKATKAAENAELIKEIHITVIGLKKDVEWLKEKK